MTQKLSWYMFLIIAMLSNCLSFYYAISPSLVLGPLMRQYHLSPKGVGWMLTMYFIGFVISHLPVGYLYDRISVRKLLFVSLLLMCVAQIGFIYTSIPFMGYLLRLIVGACTSVFIIGIFYIAKLYFPKDVFGMISGLTFGSAVIVAGSAQMFISFLLKENDWHVVFSVFPVFGLLLSLVLLFLKGEGEKKTYVQFTPQFLMQCKAFLLNRILFVNALLAGIFLIPFFIFSSMWGISFLMTHYALSNSTAAVALFILFIANAIGNIIAGVLADKFPFHRIMILLGAVACLLLWTFLLYLPQLKLYYLFTLLMVLGFFTAFQLVPWKIFNRVCSQSHAAIGVAFMSMIIQLCLFLGGFVSSFLMGSDSTNIKHLLGLSILPGSMLLSLILLCLLFQNKSNIK